MASAGSVFVDLLLRDGQFVRGMNNARRTTDSAVGAITSRLAGLAVALTAGLSVSKILEINDTFTMLESRLRLVQTGAVGASEALNRLYSISQENRQPLQESIGGYVRLAQSLTTYQRAQYDVIELSSLLAQTLKVSGTDAAGAASFYQQFGQAASSDFKAIGQELQTFADQNPVFYGLIRDEVAKTGQTLKDFAKDGKLSFDFVAKVLTDNVGTIRTQSQSMATTVGQAGTVLQNSFDNYIRLSPDVDKASALITKGILGVASAFDSARENGVNFTTAIGGIIGTYYKVELAAERAKLSTFDIFMTDEEVQRQKARIADLESDLNSLGDVLLELNKPLDNGGGDNPLAGNPPIPPQPPLPPTQETIEAIRDLGAEYRSLIPYLDGLDTATREYLETQTLLENALADGFINPEQYEEALGRIRAEFDKTKEKADGTFFDIEKFSERAAENIQDSFADFLFDPFEKGLDGMLLGFVNTLRKMAAEAAAAQILGKVSEKGGLLSGLLSAASGLFSKGTQVYSGQPVGPFPANFVGPFADGGNIPAGKWGIVGEEGPEVAFGGQAGKTIMNASQIGGLSSGGNTYNIDARGADQSAIARLEASLFALAGPGKIEQRVINGQKRGSL